VDSLNDICSISFGGRNTKWRRSVSVRKPPQPQDLAQMPMFRGPAGTGRPFRNTKKEPLPAASEGCARRGPSLIIFRSLWASGCSNGRAPAPRTRTWLFATMLAPARSQVSPARPAEPSPGLRRRRRNGTLPAALLAAFAGDRERNRRVAITIARRRHPAAISRAPPGTEPTRRVRGPAFRPQRSGRRR